MYKANAMDNCYKGNDRGQPRMSYRRRAFVATTARSVDIIPGTACYQRGRERNKDPGNRGNCQEDILGGEGGEKLEAGGFAAEETKDKQSVSSSINFVNSENLSQEKII